MKKLLFISFALILGIGPINAQDNDPMLKEVIKLLKSNKHKIIGSVTNEEFETETPYVKKVGIEIGKDWFLFLVSDPFSDKRNIICREIIIFDKKREDCRDIVLKKNKVILDDLIKKAKEKPFEVACGILD